MPFLTDLDDRAQIRGSRDPLGLVPIWSRFGREVVGNLTTVTNGVRGFTTLILGLYFAQEVQEMEGGKGQPLLNLFLKFEQLAGYARVVINTDRSVRGLRRIQTRLNDSKRIRISAEQTDQILSNQKVYGLWGLFSMPARASELLVQRDQRLSVEARTFVEKKYLPLFGNGRSEKRGLVDLLHRPSFDLQPLGRDQELIKALAKAHGRVTSEEKVFYRDHLAWGGNSDRTNGRQRRLAEILAEHGSDDFVFRDFREVKRVAIKKKDEELVEVLDRIEAVEHLISPARILFGYLLTQNGQTTDSVVRKVKSEWKRPPRVDLDRLSTLQSEIAAATGSTKAASRWVEIAGSLAKGEYAALIGYLVEANTEVMRSRNGSAAWVSIESGRLRVRQPDEAENLLSVSDVEDQWRSTYFINSLWYVSQEVA
ncbi:MAG TPA: hypothetical protein VGQ12_17570 [Candidatus Angelobacter sp.]|jgi:hypothetical protein|nr:hypothetical protein [Candidatus Angelobacter sp.]